MILDRSSDYKVMTMRNKEEAVVVFSGGQDSTTCLLWALSRYKKVYAISFDYGQRHVAELDCAKEIAEKLGVEHYILDMTLLNALGVIVDKELTDRDKIEKLFTELNYEFGKMEPTKSEVVQIIKDYLPNFEHIETGKSLDSKM